jgi:hypothetical protein
MSAVATCFTFDRFRTEPELQDTQHGRRVAMRHAIETSQLIGVSRRGTGKNSSGLLDRPRAAALKFWTHEVLALESGRSQESQAVYRPNGERGLRESQKARHDFAVSEQFGAQSPPLAQGAAFQP